MVRNHGSFTGPMVDNHGSDTRGLTFEYEICIYLFVGRRQAIYRIRKGDISNFNTVIMVTLKLEFIK